MFSLRNLTVPQVLVGLLALLGLAGAVAYAVAQTGESSADVTEAWRQEIIDGSSMLRQVGVSKSAAITYVAAQTGMTTTEADPLVSQAFGSGRDPLALMTEPMSYFATYGNTAAWTRVAENFCVPLLFRGPSTSIYTTCMTNNDVRNGIRQCSAGSTSTQTGFLSRITMTPTSRQRAEYMQANSPVTGLSTVVRANEGTQQAALGWVDCPWTVGMEDDPYLPQVTNNTPSYLLLVATVTGTITQAPGGLTFSLAPAGVAGACVVVGSSYTCTVTRPGGSSKNQTLTLTATGVDADGNPGVTTRTVALVYP